MFSHGPGKKGKSSSPVGRNSNCQWIISMASQGVFFKDQEAANTCGLRNAGGYSSHSYKQNHPVAHAWILRVYLYTMILNWVFSGRNLNPKHLSIPGWQYTKNTRPISRWCFKCQELCSIRFPVVDTSFSSVLWSCHSPMLTTRLVSPWGEYTYLENLGK